MVAVNCRKSMLKWPTTYVKNVKNIKKNICAIFLICFNTVCGWSMRKRSPCFKKSRNRSNSFQNLVYTINSLQYDEEKKNTIFADSFENLSLLTTSASKSLVKKRLIMMMMILPTTKS